MSGILAALLVRPALPRRRLRLREWTIDALNAWKCVLGFMTEAEYEAASRPRKRKRVATK